MTKPIAAVLLGSALAVSASMPVLSRQAVVHFTPPNHVSINQAGKGGSFRSTADSNAVVITSFTAGFSDPNAVIPNFDAVPGAGVDNWDIALPVAVLHIGYNYTYQMTFHSVSYSGTCKATYKLMQGQTTLDSGTLVKKLDCTSPSIWAYFVNGPQIPNSPGPATLIGTLEFGGNKSTVKVPMLIK